MSEKIRVFVAVPISEEVRVAIYRIIEEGMRAFPTVKWESPEKIHVTLKFLGEIAEERLNKVSQIVRKVSAEAKGFAMNAVGMGAFPNIKFPKVVWIRVKEGADVLKSLAGRFETEFTKAGFPKEQREFSAHLTIARIKPPFNNDSSRFNANAPQQWRRDSLPDDKFMEFVNANQNSGFGTTQVGEIMLMKSTLTKLGSIYQPLEIVKLNPEIDVIPVK